MKLLVVLSSLLAIAYSSSRYECFQTDYPLDKGFRYLYIGMTQTKIPMLSEENSELILKTQVDLMKEDSETYLIKLEKPELFAQQQADTNEPINDVVNDQMREFLEKPIRFSIENGSLKGVMVLQTDEAWSADIKFGIIQLFQYSCKRNAIENTPAGTFDVVTDWTNGTIYKAYTPYLKYPSPNARIFKIREISQSSNAVIHLKQIDGNYIINEENVNGNIDFTVRGGNMDTKATTILSQTLKFYKLIPRQQVTGKFVPFRVIHERRRRDNPAFQKDYIYKINELVREMVIAQSEPNDKASELMIELQKYIPFLSSDSIIQIMKGFEKESKERKIFISSLMLPTEAVLFSLRTFIKDKELSDSVMSLYLLRAVINFRTSDRVIRELMSLSKEPILSKFLNNRIHLTVGNMITQFNDTETFYNDLRNEVAEYLFNELQHFTPSTVEFRMVLKALGTSGLHTEKWINKLLEISHNGCKKHNLEDQIQAVNSMRKLIKEEDLIFHSLFPIYKNEEMHPELRIECFKTIMKVSMSPLKLQSLATLLTQRSKTNMQVGNFVYNYINQLSTMPFSSNAQFNSLVKTAISLTSRLDSYQNGIMYSKNVRLFHQQVGDWLHYFTELEYIRSPDQFFPRRLAWQLFQMLPKSFKNLIEIGVRAEGIDTLLQKFLGPKAELELIKHLIMQYQDSSADLKKPNLELSLLVANNEMGAWNFDEEELESLIKDITSLWEPTEHQYTFDVAKTMPLTDMRLHIHTMIGFPLTLEFFTNVNIFSTGTLNKKPTDDSMMLEGDIFNRARIFTEFRFGVDIPHIRSGITTKHTLHFSAPMNINLNYDKGHTFSNFIVKLVPRSEKTPLFETDIFTSTLVEVRELTPSKIVTKIWKHSSSEIIPFGERRSFKTIEYEFEEVFGKEVLKIIKIAPKVENGYRTPQFPFTARKMFSIVYQSKSPVMFAINNVFEKLNLYKNKFELTLKVAAKEERTASLSTTLDFETYSFGMKLNFPSFEPVCMKLEFPKYERRFLKLREQNPFELTLKAFWGGTQCSTEQMTARIVFEKSAEEIQIDIEEIEKKIKDSPCVKCETLPKLSVFCEHCKERRNIFSQFQSNVEIKNYDEIHPIVREYFELLPYIWEKFSTFQSNQCEKTTPFAPIRPVHSDRKFYQLTAKTNRQYSVLDIEVINEKTGKCLIYKGIPTLPYALRPSMENRPLSEYFRTMKELLFRPTWNKCMIDNKDRIITSDNLLYTSKLPTNCEQTLLEGNINETKLIVSTKRVNDQKKILIKDGKMEITVEPTKTGNDFIVMINNHKMLVPIFENELVLIERRIPSVENELNPIEVIVLLKHYDLVVIHKRSLIITHVSPWYTSRLVGLCGFYDGEVLTSNEFVLRNGRSAKSFKEFIREYSDKKCRINF